MFRKSEGVHAVVRKIDATMLELTQTVRQFGIPKGLGTPLNQAKNAVGNLVSHLQMTERRSDDDA